MAFTAVGMARNLHDFGLKRTEYEAACKSTIDSLIQIRAESAINYKVEASLIEFLEEIENGKDQAAGKTALDLGSKTVKLCAGPVAGVASSILTSVVKKQGAGSEDLVGDLTESVMEAGINQIQKEATKEICNTTSEWAFGYAADWLGIAAGTAAVAFAPMAIGVAGIVGATACVMSSTVRAACTDYVSATAKGTGALFSEVFSNGKNREIISSYKLWNHKWTKYKAKQAVIDQKNTEIEYQNDALRLHRTNRAAVKNQIKERKKEFFNRFVHFVNWSSDLLTRIFSSMSTRFEKEINVQNELRAEKKNLKISIRDQIDLIENLNGEVDQLSLKLLNKKPIVDNLEIEYSNLLA